MLAGLWGGYRGQMAADFQRYYGATPRRLIRGGEPLSDVAAMAIHLPRESATMLAVHPREEIELWQADTYLLATLADLLASGNWQRSGGKGARPKPAKRPERVSRRVDTTRESLEAFRDWYAQQPGGRQL